MSDSESVSRRSSAGPELNGEDSEGEMGLGKQQNEVDGHESKTVQGPKNEKKVDEEKAAEWTAVLQTLIKGKTLVNREASFHY